MRVVIQGNPYFEPTQRDIDFGKRGSWPCRWVRCADAGDPPFVTAYRREFTLAQSASLRVHVTADERYELFLDGNRVGRGSERGDRNNWFFETYDLQIPAGKHVFVARIWTMGPGSPMAQMTVTPGFLFSPEGEDFIKLLGSGVAPWEAKKLGGYSYTGCGAAFGTGLKIVVDGAAFDWGYETGEGPGWKPVVPLHFGTDGYVGNNVALVHYLKPAMLPAMIEQERAVGAVRHVSAVGTDNTHPIAITAASDLPAEHAPWNLLRTGGSITLPPQTTRRVLIDLEDYYCAYPEMIVSGGKSSRIRILWAEALYREPITDWRGCWWEHCWKDNRNEVEGKYFFGLGDTFLPDGGQNRRFDTLWWQPGRYIELLVQTADEALTINRFAIRETRYPLERETEFRSSEPRIEAFFPIALRSLQMCAHETYMDCPYYEQMMYTGDTRLQVLTTYALTRDGLLPRKALRMYDISRLHSGMTQSRYPSRSMHIIPPFSLWWVAMVHDYAMWRDDMPFVRSLMPGVRGVMDCLHNSMNEQGFVHTPNFWNFMDWVPGWVHGIPPAAHYDVCGMFQWQMVLVLGMVAELEEAVGEPELAARARRFASELAARTHSAFWNEQRHLFADDLAHTQFYEHNQILALLTGQLDPATREKVVPALFSEPGLAQTTIYFTHYMFELCRQLGRMDVFFDRLQLWYGLEPNGFKTTFEFPEPTRSDCHAWGAHPIFHMFATVLGIRPDSPGFRTVRITPQLGSLKEARGRLVHPHGFIEADLRAGGGAIHGSITLPEDVSGVFIANGREIPLRPGKQEV